MNSKPQAAKIEIKITGTKQAFNAWTMATATIDGENYEIQMVRFDEPSQYGIRSGKISKLWIADDRKEIVNYDRGWDQRPATATAKAIVNAIIAKFN